MRNEFELTEVLLEVADPGLTDGDRQELCIALHAAEPFEAIVTIVRVLARADIALPRNVFDDFHAWMRTLPGLDDGDERFPLRLALYLLATDLRPSETTAPSSDADAVCDVCDVILDEAGVVDATHDYQAAALRNWLDANRPGPALRADLWANGFGYLLARGDDSEWSR